MYTTSGEWSRCQRLSDLEAHSQSGKNTGTLSVACILGTGILLDKVENARSSVRKPLGGGGGAVHDLVRSQMHDRQDSPSYCKLRMCIVCGIHL
jgi:hypothetical protein